MSNTKSDLLESYTSAKVYRGISEIWEALSSTQSTQIVAGILDGVLYMLPVTNDNDVSTDQ